jgi:peptide/nickel transport system substrate-binding protein
LVVLGWTGYDGNVDHFGFFHSSGIPVGTGSGNNRLRVNIPRVDKILELYLQEPDVAKRIKLYQEMHAILQEEAVTIFTHHPKTTAGMDKNLMGVKISLSSTFFNVEDWYWKK